MATVTAIKNKTQSKIALKKVVEYVSQNKKSCLSRMTGISSCCPVKAVAETFKDYEVLVATRIDNDHWHNHLIVNSVG